MQRRRRSGFTLLEILVVVMIIAILASIVGIKVIPQLGKAKITAARTQIERFGVGLKLYRMDNNVYPTQQQGLSALCRKPTSSPVPVAYPDGGYLDSREIPTDPWGQAYAYLVPGPEDEPYEILSYGADREPGGDGEAADLSSADIER